MTDIQSQGDKFVQQLVEDIRKEISALYKVCEGIAMLDMVRQTPICAPLPGKFG